MFIVSKDKNSIVNAEMVTALFIGGDNCTIKADFQNSRGCQLGRYNSEMAAKKAIELITNEMARNGICFMPSDDEVNTKMNTFEQKHHNIGGKKTKGHGGS